MKKAFFLFIISISATAAFSQLHWISIDSLFKPLPPSIKVYRTNDSLEKLPFIAYYVSIDLKDRHIKYTTQVGNGKRYTPMQYFLSGKKPLIVVNGTFFNFQTNQNLGLVLTNKKLRAYNITVLKGRGEDSGLYYYPTRSAIGISKKRRVDVAWTFTDSAKRFVYAFEDSPVVAKGKDSVGSIILLKRFDWQKWKMHTAIGGGPTLIHNGKIYITDKEEQIAVGGQKDKHPRTAMGYTKEGKLIIFAIQGRMPGIAEGATLLQEAKILLDLGCWEALNMDGGGSSCLLVNGKETIRPSDKEGERPVPAVLIIKN